MTAVAASTSASCIAADQLAYRYEQLRDEGLGHRRSTSSSVSMAQTIVVRQGVAAWLRLVEPADPDEPSSREPTPAPEPSCPELLSVLTNLVFQAHGEGSDHE